MRRLVNHLKEIADFLEKIATTGDVVEWKIPKQKDHSAILAKIEDEEMGHRGMMEERMAEIRKIFRDLQEFSDA